MRILRALLTGLFFLWSAIAPATAGFVIDPYRFAVSVPPSLTRGTCIATTSNASTYNSAFTATPTGASDADTVYVVVGVIGIDNLASFGVSSMTIDGTAATEIVDDNGAVAIDAAFYVSSSASANNATVNISVTFTEAITSVVMCAWALKDLVSGTADSSNSASDNGGAQITFTLGTNVSPGFAIGICGSLSTSATTTWGVLTERQDACHAEGCYSNADAATTGSSMAVTCDYTTLSGAAGAAVAFH